MPDRPEQFEGAVTIGWTQGPAPMPGWRFMPRTEDGQAITTVTHLTLHASAQDVVWAELTMFADEDGKPLFEGAAVILPGPEHGEILTGTFAFLVMAMTVEPR